MLLFVGTIKIRGSISFSLDIPCAKICGTPENGGVCVTKERQRDTEARLSAKTAGDALSTHDRQVLLLPIYQCAPKKEGRRRPFTSQQPPHLSCHTRSRL